jgi:hypothetical protein
MMFFFWILILLSNVFNLIGNYTAGVILFSSALICRLLAEILKELKRIKQ